MTSKLRILCRAACAGLLVVAGASAAVAADDLEKLRQGSLRLILDQVRAGVLTQRQADELIKQLEPAAEPAARSGDRSQPGAAARAPETREAFKEELRKELEEQLRRKLGEDLRRELEQTSQAQAVAPAKDRELAIQTLSQTTQQLIEILERTGILTQQRADTLVREARLKAGEAAAASGKSEARVIRVPYVPLQVRDEIKDELRAEILNQAISERWAAPGTIPEWTNRVKIGGDLRLRYQGVYYSADNAAYLSVQDVNASGANPPPLLNTTHDTQDERLRLRISLEAKVADEVTVGARLASGNTTNPVSTNQTLGHGFNRSALLLDRAWARYEPFTGLSLTGGRMPNPWFATDLVWDEDLSFEGLVADYRKPFAQRSSAFGTLGAFPLDKGDCTLASQSSSCGRDKWLYGAQLGVDHSFGGDSGFKLGLAYYVYRNVAGELVTDPSVDPRSRVPSFAQKGNSLFNVDTFGGTYLGLASDFKELALTGRLDIDEALPVHLALTGEVVKNLGFDTDKIQARTGGGGFFGPGGIAAGDQRARTLAYALGATVGRRKIERAGDWQIFAVYKHLERDSVLDAYTDSDFHLGGTDARGWVLGASYAVARNSWLRARWLTANAIDGPPLAIDVLQLDFNARF
jgi:hypothetical protein